MKNLKEQKQKIVDGEIGDCFRACMASLLQLPIEVLPNDHSAMWFDNWRHYLGQFGLSIKHNSASGPIWSQEPWIASVHSKNFKGGIHAILMHNTYEVLFDPSTKKTFKKGTRLLGKQIVVGGTHLIVADASKLHLLSEYRQRIVKNG